MNSTDLLQKAKRELSSVSQQAYQESLWILAYSLNEPVNQIYSKNSLVTSKQEDSFWKKINQRKQAVPLEYILKEKFFFGHKFYIEEPVFIPRMETETLVKWVCKNFNKKQFLNFIDFGAGAGALVLSILYYFPKSMGIAVELYSKSIECLKKNALNLNLQDRLSILQKDVSKIYPEDLYKLSLDTHKAHPFFRACHFRESENLQQQQSKKDSSSFIAPDLITANPPYIDPRDKSCQKAVYLYESPLALFSDQKGLGHIISWFERAMELLKPNGLYLFEFAWNQEEQIIKFLNNQVKLDSYQILKDQLGQARIAVCFKKRKSNE